MTYYIPENLSFPANQTMVIEKVFVAVNKPIGTTGRSSQGNHWCFYMQVSSERSVRLEMITKGKAGVKVRNGYAGLLSVQYLNYRMSNKVAKYFEVNRRTTFTLKDVISEIQTKGYEKYDFNSKGEGCRYWVFKVLELLKEKGLIGSYSEVLDALSKTWGVGGGLPREKGVEKGTFHWMEA